MDFTTIVRCLHHLHKEDATYASTRTTLVQALIAVSFEQQRSGVVAQLANGVLACGDIAILQAAHAAWVRNAAHLTDRIHRRVTYGPMARTIMPYAPSLEHCRHAAHPDLARFVVSTSAPPDQSVFSAFDLLLAHPQLMSSALPAHATILRSLLMVDALWYGSHAPFHPQTFAKQLMERAAKGRDGIATAGLLARFWACTNPESILLDACTPLLPFTQALLLVRLYGTPDMLVSTLRCLQSNGEHTPSAHALLAIVHAMPTPENLHQLIQTGPFGAKRAQDAMFYALTRPTDPNPKLAALPRDALAP